MDTGCKLYTYTILTTVRNTELFRVRLLLIIWEKIAIGVFLSPVDSAVYPST